MRVSASSNPSCVQDQGEFDASEKKVLAEPVGSLLQQVAEKTKGYIDRFAPKIHSASWIYSHTLFFSCVRAYITAQRRRRMFDCEMWVQDPSTRRKVEGPAQQIRGG